VSLVDAIGVLTQRFLTRHLVQDLPDGLQACEMCRHTDCTQARAEACSYRLQVDYTTSQTRVQSGHEGAPPLRMAAE
jgi:hypothetical protein